MTAFAVGTEVVGLRIDEVAAHGGTSIVYRATDLATNQQRAVKVLQDPDQASTRRLRREAALLAGVHHRCIVQFHDLHELDNDLLLVTTWIDGESLRDRLRRGETLSTREAGYLLTRLAAPLDYLHDNGIVHRDISPSNVIERPDGSLVLVDLGIGHNVASATLTNCDLVAGTPKYLAPEIIRGHSATALSDQYSSAVLLHELVTGSSPFPQSDGIATALHHQVNTAPIPLTEIDPTISPPLSAAVLRALSKNPADRFTSVGEFARAATSPNLRPETSSGRARNIALAVTAMLVLLLGVVLFRPSGGADSLVDAADSSGVVDSSQLTRGDEVLGLAQPTDAAPEPVEALPEATDIAPSDSAPDDLGTNPDAPAVATAWTDGLAAELACNQLVGSTFRDGIVPLDYFGDPPGRERVVDGRGFDSSWALEVGTENEYGQYAEVIPIEPGQQYWFRGWFAAEGPIADAQMGITLLDANYESTGLTVDRSVLSGGFVEVQLADVPQNATFALPFLFKDSSPGVLIADELVFGITDACFNQITSGG